MNTIEPDRDLTAIGRLAGRLGATVDQVSEVATQLGLSPAMRVDSVVFYDRESAQRIADGLAGKRATERLVYRNDDAETV